METTTFDSFLDEAGKKRLSTPEEMFVQASYVFNIDLGQVRGDELGAPCGDFLRWLRRARAENESLDAAIRGGEILADDNGLWSGRHCGAASFRLATEAVATYMATHGTGRGRLQVDVRLALADVDGEPLTMLSDDEAIDLAFFSRSVLLEDGETQIHSGWRPWRTGTEDCHV